MVVRGPWPGMTRVSSGRGSSRSWIDRRIFHESPPGRSVRPMDPAKSVSPAISSFSGAKCRQMLPGVCPGVCRTLGRVACNPDDHSLFRAGVGGSDLRRLDAQPSRLHVHHLQQRKVILIQQNRSARRPLELYCASNVIDMRMGHHDLPEI